MTLWIHKTVARLPLGRTFVFIGFPTSVSWLPYRQLGTLMSAVRNTNEPS